MIQKATVNELPILAELACQLWPEHTAREIREAYAAIMEKPDAAFFLAYGEGTAVGFAQCQLRHDYVEGTDSSPVGYLEGIYVAENCRKQGIAKALLAACENWAKAQGCTEFASDCELDNAHSLQFHLNMGFREVNRIICFAKKL
jgi:aminoglycoside 6'-N-acetyltransferase I